MPERALSGVVDEAIGYTGMGAVMDWCYKLGRHIDLCCPKWLPLATCGTLKLNQLNEIKNSVSRLLWLHFRYSTAT